MVGMKSDYRRAMSPITLAPKTINPWTNPMKRGIVSPAYNPAETIPYKFGTHWASNTAATNKLYWSDYDTNIGDEIGAHMIVLNAWNVTPGVKSITELILHGNYFGTGHNTSFTVEVWRINGTNLERVAATANVIAQVAGSALKATINLAATPLVVTLADGYDYFVGVRLIRLNTVSSTPQPNRSTDADFTLHSYVIGLQSTFATSNLIPLAGSASAPYANVSAEHSHVCIQIAYASTNYIEQDITTNTIGKYEIARPQDRVGFVKYEGVVVADGEALTILHQTITNPSWDTTVFCTTELDCGDTTGGQNDIIYDGGTVNLPDLDPAGTGAVGQEGKTFDLFHVIVLGSLKNDLYWQCRHLEQALHSHKVASGGTRGVRYDHTEPLHFLTTSGTATIAKIRVGTNPVILCGDSQTIYGYEESLRQPNDVAWGQIPDDLTKPRIWILHGQAGGTWSGMLTGVWKSATPGEADGVELVGTGGVWVFAGIGINDINVVAPLNVGDTQRAVNQILNDFTEMLESITDKIATDRLLVLGMPPSDAVTTSAYEADAIRRLNRGLLGIALANRCPFYNPWPDLVLPGTENEDIPTLPDAYQTLANDGTHIGAAGGAVIVPNAIAAFENSTIDLRDAWN